MPSFVVSVQHYHLHFVHNKSAGTSPSHTRLRTIQEAFGALPGVSGSYALLFRAEPDWVQTGELKKTNGYDVTARLPVNEFTDYLTLFQTEQSIKIWVDYPAEPAIGQRVPMINWSLFTGNEPLGEGPKDTSLVNLQGIVRLTNNRLHK